VKHPFTEQRGVVVCSMGPLMVFMGMFSLLPILYALYISLHGWGFAEGPEFVGIGNYQRALSGTDPLFYKSLWNTLKFVLLTIPATNALAIVVAKLITKSGRWEPLFRTAFFLPVVTNIVAVCLLWEFFYRGDGSGLFNGILALVGVPNQLWLRDANLAMPSIALMQVWNGLGFSVILYTAGLKNIPRTYYDAAKVDGAEAMGRFFYVTVPLLMPTITFCIVTGTIGAFQVFGQVLIMTSGGPLNATRTIVYHLYTAAFDYFNMGYACAMAFILLAVIGLFTVILFRLTRTEWEY